MVTFGALWYEMTWKDTYALLALWEFKKGPVMPRFDGVTLEKLLKK